MENYNGVVLDPRPAYKKALDYQHDDVVGAVTLNWKEKPQSEWKKYTPREQDGSLSCVAQSTAKAMEIIGYGVESAHPIYTRRANFPDGGMWPQNAGEIARTLGTCKESIDISQNLGESKLNLPLTVETPDKILNYVMISNPKDIDKIAEAIELQGNCMLLFHANGNEWTSIPTYNGQVVNFGHEVCAVDYFIYQGKKVVLIEDSTGHYSTMDGQHRIITEDFLKARCDGAMYLTPKPIIPPHIFKPVLKLGSISQEVKYLQIKLGIGADGIFGQKTKEAVMAFQMKHNLRPDGIVGTLTCAELNK